MLNLSLCDEFSYPPQIKEQLVRILSAVDASKIRAVLLYGSTALGESGFQLSHGNIELYSDYEFLIVARDTVDKGYRKRLSEHFLMLEREFSSNPLFKIDFTYVAAKTLHKGFRHITAVNWHDAIPMFGEDVRPLIPELNKETVNRYFHNEMLMWRLWTSILYCPIEVLINKEVPGQKESWWKYVLCKNCLTILMWLLPLEGIFLSSYREKIDHISQSYRDLKASHFFDDGFIDFLNECHIGKTRIEFRRDAVGLFERVTKYYLSARRYLLSTGGFREDRRFSEARGVFFIDNSVRRMMYDLYLLIFKARTIPGMGIRWFLNSKYGFMMDFLYDMNLALGSYLNHHEGEAERHLTRASQSLRTIVLNNSMRGHTEAETFPERWILLRDIFAEFLSMYIPSLKVFNDKILKRNSP